MSATPRPPEDITFDRYQTIVRRAVRLFGRGELIPIADALRAAVDNETIGLLRGISDIRFYWELLHIEKIHAEAVRVARSAPFRPKEPIDPGPGTELIYTTAKMRYLMGPERLLFSAAEYRPFEEEDPQC